MGHGEGFHWAENREHNTLSAFPGIFLPSTTDPTHSTHITRCGHAAEAGVAAEILLYDHWCALSSILSALRVYDCTLMTQYKCGGSRGGIK
jgi:hypothetical protein